MALIIPEVYSQMLREKMLGKLRLGGRCVQLDLPQFRQVGETVIFPKFNLIGEVEDLPQGKDFVMKPEKLQQSSSSATVMHKGKTVRVNDYDDLTALGNFIEEAKEQQALRFAQCLDKELYKEALKTKLKVPTSEGTKITSEELSAGLAKFGDDVDAESFDAIYIHSLVQDSFMQMPLFIDLTKATAIYGNGIMVRGCIGTFRGIPVIVSDTMMDNNECTTLIVKKNALAYMLKRDLFVEEERESKSKATDIVADMLFAVKQIDDLGIVVLRKTTTNKTA